MKGVFCIKNVVKQTFSLFSALFVASLFSSCNPDDSGADKQDVDGAPVSYRVVSVEDIAATELLDYLLAFAGGAGGDAASDKEVMFVEAIKRRQDAVSEKLGVEGVTLGYRKVVYRYRSTDVKGDSVELSAVVCWERYKLDTWCDLPSDGIALVEHYTVTKNNEVPSECFPVEAALLPGKLVVMPDYLGYGITKDKLHPYLNYEVCVANSMDALEAGYALYKEYSAVELQKGWKSYLLGASQGGGNALAVHKYMDTNKKVADKWNFAYSFCAAGPYSLEVTMRSYLESGETVYPVVFPLVLRSMLLSYPEMMGEWKEEDFYSEKYLEIREKVNGMIDSKEYTTNEIIAVIFAHFNVSGGVKLADMLSEKALDVESDMMKSLFSCFALNDLTKGWEPLHPIKLYHSSSDKVVPFANAEALMASFGNDKVTLVKSAEGDSHVASCAKWMLMLFANGL